MDNYNDYISRQSVIDLINSMDIITLPNCKNVVDVEDLIWQIYSIPLKGDIIDSRLYNHAIQDNRTNRTLEEISMVVIKDGGME